MLYLYKCLSKVEFCQSCQHDFETPWTIQLWNSSGQTTVVFWSIRTQVSLLGRQILCHNWAVYIYINVAFWNSHGNRQLSSWLTDSLGLPSVFPTPFLLKLHVLQVFSTTGRSAGASAGLFLQDMYPLSHGFSSPSGTVGTFCNCSEVLPNQSSFWRLPVCSTSFFVCDRFFLC